MTPSQGTISVLIMRRWILLSFGEPSVKTELSRVARRQRGWVPRSGWAMGGPVGERGPDRRSFGQHLRLSFRLTDGFSLGWAACCCFQCKSVTFLDS